MIPTYRRHEILRASLRQWRLSRRLPDQLIVVDASPDAAVEGARTTAAFSDLFQGAGSAYLVSPIASISQQRNQALPLVETDVVVFADDETEPTPLYLDRLLEVYAADVGGQIGGVGGLLDDWGWRIRDGLATVLARPVARRFYMTHDQAFPLGEKLPATVSGLPVHPVRNLVGNRMSFRTELARAQGFDARMLRYSFLEDLDISVRASRTHHLVIRRDATIRHRPAQAGRIGSTAMLLTSFINPAYLIEKLFPTAANRRPLDRLLALSEMRALANPAVEFRAARRRRVREEYTVARAMVAFLRSGPDTGLGARFSLLQEYVHGAGHDTRTLGSIAAARSWLDQHGNAR